MDKLLLLSATIKITIAPDVEFFIPPCKTGEVTPVVKYGYPPKFIKKTAYHIKHHHDWV